MRSVEKGGAQILALLLSDITGMYYGMCRCVCVCLCVDVWMPDLREVCDVEPPRVLFLDNWCVCV